MQFGGKKPAAGIVYDSDFGRTIDSLLALALLHGLEGKTEARIAALTITNSDLKSAQLCDVIEKFYASATTGLAATFFQGLPIGLAADQQSKTNVSTMAAVLLTRQDDTGAPLYSPRVRTLNDTAVPEVLIRNALSAQYDQNAAVVLAGPATNLSRLLDMPGAKDLIRGKVKFLVIAGGSFPAGPPEAAFVADLRAARRLFAEWPTPIVSTGGEVGDTLRFPGGSIEKDFSYSAVHPIAAAYRAYGTMPYDAPAPDMAAMLYAARPNDSGFKLSEPGQIIIGEDGRTTFRGSESGLHRYLIVDSEQAQKVLKIYTELASAKPVPRRLRFPVADDQKVDEKPAADEKKAKPE